MNADERTKYYGHWSTAELALKSVTKERDAALHQRDAASEKLEKVEHERDRLLLQVREMRTALESARAWMSHDGCDCGVDEGGSCGLCLVKAALSEKRKNELGLCKCGHAMGQHTVGGPCAGECNASNNLGTPICGCCTPELDG